MKALIMRIIPECCNAAADSLHFVVQWGHFELISGLLELKIYDKIKARF